MSSWLFALVALGVVLVEGIFLSLLGLYDIAFGWSLFIVVYMGLRRPFIPACLTLLVLILPIEWATCSVPVGLYSLILVLIFLVLRLFKMRLEKKWGFAHTGLVFIASICHHLLSSGYILITRPESLILAAIWHTIMISALLSIPTAVLMGYGLDRLNDLLSSKRKSKGL